MRLLTQKEASKYLGYSENSNILAKMRAQNAKEIWDFIPRYVVFNGVIRYPLEWLENDVKNYIENKK